jgi:hypothetical protein
MRATRLALAVSVLGITALTACADDALAPEQQVIVPFAIDDVQRTTLIGVLRSAANVDAPSAFTDGDARARVMTEFDRLSERVAQNDRDGARRAVRTARAALRAFEEGAPSDPGVLLELQALALALDHTEMLAGDAPGSLYVAGQQEEFD